MIRLILILLILAGPAAAQTPDVADPRIRTVVYDVDRVVRVQVPTGFHTAILFGPDEQVDNVAIGDETAWDATLNEAGSALFLKPLRASGTTNMTVVTSVRVYAFELSSAYGQSADAPFTLRFTYPDTDGATAGAATARPGRYRLTGARSVRPAAISDDGRRTYVEWRSDQAIPAVFAVDARGQRRLVEGRMQNRLYVIDGVHPALEFHLDGRRAGASRLAERSGR